MKKIISGIFAGALSVVVLTWAFDAMGRTGHEGGGNLDPASADTNHGRPEAVNENAEDADGDYAEGRSARTNMSRRALASLELTEEQQEKIKALRSAYTREMIQLRADSRLARVELRELMNETSPDVNRVKELAAAVSAAQGDVFERSAIFRAEFKNVLTQEQQETLRESFRDRRDGHRDSGMRWRRGGRESRNRR